MTDPIASLAPARANLYAWMAAVLGRLPDAELAASLRPAAVEPLLNALGRMRGKAAKEAEKALRRSAGELEQAGDAIEALLERWAIDRTRLLRQTPGKHLPPPYESLYRKKERKGQDADPLGRGEREASPTPLVVQRFYRRLDICPQDACESPDFLPLELDFLAALCRTEGEAGAEQGRAAELRAEQKAFLDNHIGVWAADYCTRALPEAKTDLYRAVLLLLPEILTLDRQFLEQTT